MPNSKTKILWPIYIAACLGALSIALGAFSTHALENLVTSDKLQPHQLEVFEKAVKYQMYHSIVLLILSLCNWIQHRMIFYKSYYTLLLGTLCFSGSLYIIALQNLSGFVFPQYLFFITPLGGLLMILGWLIIPLEIPKRSLQ